MRPDHQTDGYYAAKDYPDTLRRIKYYDAENDKMLTFLTDNMDLPALTIAELYRYSLYTILQVFSVTLFEKMPILQAFAGHEENSLEGDDCNQLKLFS